MDSTPSITNSKEGLRLGQWKGQCVKRQEWRWVFSGPDGDIRNGVCGTDTYTGFAATRPAIANKSESLSKTIENYSLATTNVYRKDLLAFLHIF